MKKKCGKFSKVLEVIKILEQKAVRAFTNYHWPRRGMNTTDILL